MKKPSPLNENLRKILLYVTERCNLNCKYCFVNKGERDLDFEIGKKAIDFLLRAGSAGKEPFYISFFGGEPLLNFSVIEKLVRYCSRKRRRFEYAVVTNGILLNDKILGFFREHRFAIVLSIDGNRQAHDISRPMRSGKGSFDLLEKNLKSLSQYPYSKTPRITFREETIPYLYESVSFLFEKGFTDIGLSGIDRKSWDKKELKALEEQLEKIADFWLGKIEEGVFFWISPFCDYMLAFENPSYPFHLHMHPCWAGDTGLAIATDGTIYPCHRFASQKMMALGNVLEESFSQKTVSQFFNVEHEAEGCLALNYLYCGDINVPHQSTLQLKQLYYDITGRMIFYLLSSSRRLSADGSKKTFYDLFHELRERS
jgi:uncharacterized protein